MLKGEEWDYRIHGTQYKNELHKQAIPQLENMRQIGHGTA